MHPTINLEDINQARELIYKIAGLYMPQNKDSTIKNRLDKLSRELNIKDYSEFFMGLKHGKFKQEFINAFTTNKTDFFREGFHFEDMMNRILPHRLQDNEPFEVLCAASSTGEEPYSIAATLLFAKEIYHSNTQVSVQAIDIDTFVLEVARVGNYIIDTNLNPLPTWIELKNYFDITRLSEHKIRMQAKQNLKKILTFKQHNLCAHVYPFSGKKFDIIFCRNVLIYFKVEDQEQILSKLFSHLKLGGTLYLGHSESILGLASKVDRLGQNIFIKVAE
ncbi:protein-glutamate O-methyltransferase CheR [Helicobacter sp. MIT 11-5569]|uniref:CheR family methyltransferase n=1 Tax=Helicobacter sp. MIT 11-5569 TaxID=1548151 RepID=UPI00051FC578|nr:protein-glutamate O-methyltransferase CheR [Helicobacter sp. MIT 11-5569]TLD85289.1 protein-glutamate O-methyltransferase CheR [Helicobacter sp. MIT 11-5569]